MDDKDIYLENYKLLVDLVKHEGKLYWDRYNVWLVLISAILVATQYAEPLDLFGLELSFFISILGLITSVVWFSTASRSRKQVNHYISIARDIENNKLKKLTIWKDEEKLKEKYRFYDKSSILKMSLIIPFFFSIIFFLLLLSNTFSLFGLIA